MWMLDAIIIVLSLAAIAAVMLALYIFVESRVKYFLLRRLDRPLLNKDMTDSERTGFGTDLFGYPIREAPEHPNCQCYQPKLEKQWPSDILHEQLVMELGDDVLKGYTPGDGK